MVEIEGNDVKFKESLKINFLGVAILKQDFVFEVKFKNGETYNRYANGHYFCESHPGYDDTIASITKVLASDLDDKYTWYKKLEHKPIYHCYLLLDIGNILSQPIIFWSMEYKSPRSVREMIELCNNSAKALMHKKLQKTTTVMAKVISDFKLKYGNDKIPIRMIDCDFAVKKNLPGITSSSGHRNTRQFI